MESSLQKVLKKAIFSGCCFFALTLPFDFSLSTIGIYFPFLKTFLELQIVLLLVLWEIDIICSRRIKITVTRLGLPILFFFGIHLFSSLFPSERLVWSIKYTARFFGIGLIYFIVVNFVKTRGQIQSVLGCLLGGAVLAAVPAIIQYFYPYLLRDAQYFFEPLILSPQRVRGFFGWPTNMSVYLGTIVPLGVSWMLSSRERTERKPVLFCAFALAVLFFAQILSKTRGWIIGLFCGMGFLWFAYTLRAKKYVFARVTAFVAVFICIVGVLIGAYSFFTNDLETTEKSRLILGRYALQTIGEAPLRGIGADMFIWSIPAHLRTHNIVLETAVNLGVVGLAIFVWLIARLFSVVGRGMLAIGNESFYIQAGVLAALVSFLGHCQVDFFWHNPKIAGLFWMVCGIGVCAQRLVFGRSSIKEEGDQRWEKTG